MLENQVSQIKFDTDSQQVLVSDDGSKVKSLPTAKLLFDWTKLAIFVVGTIGNCIALAAMRRQVGNARPYALTLTILAMVNSLTLTAIAVESVDSLLSHSLGTDSLETRINSVGCKIYRLVPAVCQMTAHWVLVLVNTERFCAICYPLKRTFTMKKTLLALAFIVFAAFASQTWRLPFDYKQEAELLSVPVKTVVFKGRPQSFVRVVRTSPECTATDLSLYVAIDVFANQMALLFLLPAGLILTMNILAIRSIHNASKTLHRSKLVKSLTRLSSLTVFVATWKRNTDVAPSALEPRRTVERRTSESTRLLVALTAGFLLLRSPQVILFAYIQATHWVSGHQAGIEIYKRFNQLQLTQIATLLTAINYADTFFIFFVTSPGFRRTVRKMMHLAGKGVSRIQVWDENGRRVSVVRTDLKVADSGRTTASTQLSVASCDSRHSKVESPYLVLPKLTATLTARTI